LSCARPITVPSPFYIFPPIHPHFPPRRFKGSARSRAKAASALHRVQGSLGGAMNIYVPTSPRGRGGGQHRAGGGALGSETTTALAAHRMATSASSGGQASTSANGSGDGPGKDGPAAESAIAAARGGGSNSGGGSTGGGGGTGGSGTGGGGTGSSGTSGGNAASGGGDNGFRPLLVPLFNIRTDADIVRTIRVTPTRVYISGLDQSVVLLDPDDPSASPRWIDRLHGDSAVACVHVAASNPPAVITAAADRTVKVWTPEMSLVRTIAGLPEAGISCVTWCSVNDTIWVTEGNGKVLVMEGAGEGLRFGGALFLLCLFLVFFSFLGFFFLLLFFLSFFLSSVRFRPSSKRRTRMRWRGLKTGALGSYSTCPKWRWSSASRGRRPQGATLAGPTVSCSGRAARRAHCDTCVRVFAQRQSLPTRAVVSVHGRKIRSRRPVRGGAPLLVFFFFFFFFFSLFFF
jgi:hypothetical protein